MKGESNGNSIKVGDITFCAGYIVRYLEDYSHSCQISTHELALGVAELVRATAIGKVLGAEDQVPTLRRTSTKRSKAVEQVEVAERPHIEAPVKRRMSRKGRAAITRAQKRRWAKHNMQKSLKAANEKHYRD